MMLNELVTRLTAESHPNRTERKFFDSTLTNINTEIVKNINE